MPIPADVVRRKLERQLKNLSEPDKLTLLQDTLDEMPGYTSGPYGRLKNWIREQMNSARRQSRVLHQDQFMVKKEGLCTAALIGPPNCGKSSLLRALTGRKVRIGDYPFTTLKPVAGIVKLHGAPIQLVEIPGLIEGASGGRGSGRAYLSAVRAADVGIFTGALTDHDFELFRHVVREIDLASIELPGFMVATKDDLPGAAEVYERYCSAYPDRRPLRVSVRDGLGLEAVRDALWEVTGLIRVYPRDGDGPIVLRAGSTVLDFAESIHRGLRESVQGAQVWGQWVRFPGQPVSAEHALADLDEVLLKIRR
ncbi:MAG: GTPase [Bacillota bacterium]